MALIGDGVFAVTEGVPELYGTVTRSRDNLAIVRREGDREDVIVVTDKATGGDTGGKLP